MAILTSIYQMRISFSTENYYVVNFSDNVDAPNSKFKLVVSWLLICK